MFFSLQTLGKMILTMNVLLTGGVLVAGGSLFMADLSHDSSLPGAFERSGKSTDPTEEVSPLDDFSEITVDKFIASAPTVPQPVVQPNVPTPALDPTPAVPVAKVDFKVKGIVLSSVERFTFAIIEIGSSKEQRTVFTGEEISGLTILRIKTDCIVVDVSGEAQEVPIDITDEGGAKKVKNPAPSNGNWRRYGPNGRRSGEPGRTQPGRTGPPEDVRRLAKAAGMNPNKLPSPGAVKTMSRQDIINKLPPKLQAWWAKLPDAEKDKWEKRFRKRYKAKRQ